MSDEELVDTDAYEETARLLAAADGRIYPAFDGIDCGVTAEQATRFTLGTTLLDGVPEDRHGRVFGAMLSFAMICVIADRERRASPLSRLVLPPGVTA
jgi:hypothetical protein